MCKTGYASEGTVHPFVSSSTWRSPSAPLPAHYTKTSHEFVNQYIIVAMHINSRTAFSAQFGDTHPLPPYQAVKRKFLLKQARKKACQASQGKTYRMMSLRTWRCADSRRCCCSVAIPSFSRQPEIIHCNPDRLSSHSLPLKPKQEGTVCSTVQ